MPRALAAASIIYGGGNTAIDAARTARRLGARRGADRLSPRPCPHAAPRPFEADDALSEGVKIKWLSTIKDIGEGELTVETMRLDENGQPQPTGQLETLSADSVVLALGQRDR